MPIYESDVKYYESHITVAPQYEYPHHQKRLEEIAHQYGFRIAELLLVRPDKGVEPHRKDAFISGKDSDMPYLIAKTRRVVRELQQAGIQVFRYKIEAAVVDSRREDVWNMIPKESSDG